VEKLIETGKVKDVADIFALRREDILEAVTKKDRKTKAEPPGKIAENLLASIDTSKSRPLNRLLASLGIRGVGEVMASDLARHYPDLGALSKATVGELQEIEGVGPNIAEAIVDWFARPANQNLLAKLKAVGVWPVAQLSVTSDRSSGSLNGLSFVVTGTLASFTRDGIKEFIQSNGGKVVGSVSKNTDYLVLGENPGSKFDKAQELGVPVINEEKLRELAGQS
jgi:DNA ligase (NAD+)